MLFSTLFYLSLAIFIVGTIYKIYTWFAIDIGPESADLSYGARIGAALKGCLKAIFSPRLFSLLRAFVLDGVLQIKVARTDFVRWLMHILILFGFVGLLCMHALQDQISRNIFSDYEPTLNPYLMLRDLMGLMVVVGVILAVVRRLGIKKLRATTNSMDGYAIVILAVIFFSGFFLESAKIISEPVFNQMVNDYYGSYDEDEIMPLKAYWAKEFGVVFEQPPEEVDEDVLAEGRDMHENYCQSCHDKPQAAFVSFPLSRLLAPMGNSLNAAGANVILWYVHFLACFIGLAYLPFSRFFHMISSPLSLMVNGVAERETTATANKVTRRALALDACTHCGTCSVHCSVEPVFRILGNRAILPSEKLRGVFQMAKSKQLNADEMTLLSDGSHICTDCFRCTTLCPSGIDLQDLWFASRKHMEKRGYPAPHVRMRQQCRPGPVQPADDGQPFAVPQDLPVEGSVPSWMQSHTFAACFECQTCTNVCPVVAAQPNPGEALTLLPHQIMHAMGLGLPEMAMDARMIWDCVTCYKCQEQCPQGVHVTEVLYMLKNRSWQQRSAPTPSPAAQTAA